MSRNAYHRAHLVDKSTMYGWHCLVSLEPHWFRCARCHAVVPTWALGERWWPAFLGWRCREWLRAIPAETSPEHDPPPPPGRLL